MTTIESIDDHRSQLRARGLLFSPGDDGWDDARRAWNLVVDQRPAAVAFAESTDDVVAIVKFATAEGLRVAPQGTGHNASAIASLEGVVLLKTSRMRDVRIDAAARTARVGAGALWMDVTVPAGEHGLAALAGSSPDVGVVGYCLGGGLSWLSRQYGLACNSVRAIELVTAEGAVREVTADSEPELFWALRGGGGSFGVVTAMEIDLVPVAEVYAGALFFPLERAAEVLHAWREWTLSVPAGVTSCGRIVYVPPLPDVPEELRGRSFVLVEAACLGDQAEAERVVAPLVALGAEIDTLAMIPASALSHLHMDPEEPVPGIGGSRMLRDLPSDAVDALVAAVGPGSNTSVLSTEIRHLGGALSNPPEGHGALGTLPGAYVVFGVGIPMDEDVAAAIVRDIAALRAVLEPWDAGGDYLNLVEEPSDVSRFWDAESFARLRAVKSAYDPGEVFLANHPVPPAP